MKSRLLALNQIVEAEATRLGLEQWEVISVIEASLQRRYMRMDRVVHITIDPNSFDEPLLALECRETMAGVVWEKMTDIRPPSADSLQKDMEEYVRQKLSERNWWLVLVEIIEHQDDHYLVEVSDADVPGLQGKAAVLPLNRLSNGDRHFNKGDKIWCALTQKSKARYDGAESWIMVDTDYVATRTDSIFLKMLIQKYWHLPASTDISNDAGLVILPKDGEIGKVIGPNGRYVQQLRDISGLSRIVVVRSVEGKRPDLKLLHAVKQITNLNNVKVRPPKEGTDEWRLRVSFKEAPILIGSRGTNLRFISVLSGLRIEKMIK